MVPWESKWDLREGVFHLLDEPYGLALIAEEEMSVIVHRFLLLTPKQVDLFPLQQLLIRLGQYLVA
jgi:hypothetical protein